MVLLAPGKIFLNKLGAVKAGEEGIILSLTCSY